MEKRWVYFPLTEVAQNLAKLNQHLEIAQIAEAGHAIPYDQPDRFSAIVQAFLRSISVESLR